MRPVILFRPPDGPDSSEEDAAAAEFAVVRDRAAVHRGDLVVGRYSVLPFYEALAADLVARGAELVNSPAAHSFIADVMAWAPILGEDLTPRTWDRLEELPGATAFVVKGQTNSRKDRWDSHMFAATRTDAAAVAERLQADGLFRTQRIYYRRYEPLRRLLTAANGLPIADEHRFFLLDGNILSSGFYWIRYAKDLPAVPCAREEHVCAVRQVVSRLRGAGVLPRFLVVDVATRKDGTALVVELNDAQMSGLAGNDPCALYRTLRLELKGHRSNVAGRDVGDLQPEEPATRPDADQHLATVAVQEGAEHLAGAPQPGGRALDRLKGDEGGHG